MTASITLAHDGASAVVSPIGASLLSFTAGGRPIVVPMDAFDGAVLAPWPNRIDGGRFDFDGTTFQLPITEPERDTALHGLVADVEWSVAEQTESSVRFEVELEPTDGYPFPFFLTVTYTLAEVGLRISASALNTGPSPAPFGFGFHPWLAAGGSVVDDAQLLIPGTTWYEADDRLIPTEVHPFDDGTEIPANHVADESACIVCKDFRALRSIGGTVLDDTFGAPRRGPDGWSRARLNGADDHEIVIGMGPGFRTWQACTGDGLGDGLTRRAIAIEPMTCPPNAFAAGEPGEDFDVVAPGDQLSVEWSIALDPVLESPNADDGSASENHDASEPDADEFSESPSDSE
jgi:aldose 1-epimerase